MRAAGDGVVVADDALVLEAQDGLGIECSGPRSIRRHRIGGRVSKACIEAREEICEVRVRAVTVPHAGEAELTAEPILEGAKEPLDATFGLGAARRDPADAQFLQGSFDLCGRGSPGQLLLEGERSLRRGPVEDPVMVAVDGDRDPLRLGEGVKDMEIAVRIFFVPKRGGGDFAGGVIDRRDEGEAGSALVEPGVSAPIQLHEESSLGHPLAPTTVAGWASVPGTTQPGLSKNAVDRGMRQGEAVPLGQELAQVFVVDPGIDRLGELNDSRAGGIRYAPRGVAPAVPMDQGLGAVSADRPAQAPDLTAGETQEFGRFRHQKLATVQASEHNESLLCTGRQGDHASLYSARGGRTFLLKS